MKQTFMRYISPLRTTERRSGMRNRVRRAARSGPADQKRKPSVRAM